MTLWRHSWGALQVLPFARQYPERVSGLILSNPVDPALRSLEHIEQKRFVHPENHSRLALADIGTPAEDLHNLRSKVVSYFVDPERGWAYASWFTGADANNRLDVRVWDDYRQTPLSGSEVRRLADKISGVIYCRDDVLQPESLAEYRRLLAREKHHVLDGCAHFRWEESPQAIAQILEAVRSVGPPVDIEGDPTRFGRLASLEPDDQPHVVGDGAGDGIIAVAG